MDDKYLNPVVWDIWDVSFWTKVVHWPSALEPNLVQLKMWEHKFYFIHFPLTPPVLFPSEQTK